MAGDLHLLVPLDLLRRRSLDIQGKIVTGLGSTGCCTVSSQGCGQIENSNVERHLGAHDRVDKLLQDGGDVALRESLPCPLI